MATRNLFLITGLLTALLAARAASGADSAGAILADPRVRLWYLETGRLSDNIAPPRKFSLWNTIIGEGDAEEYANDAFFTIELRTVGQQNLSQPLTLSAIDSKGKVLAQRTFANLLTGTDGKVIAPLWVRDIGCAGHVVFTAKYGASKRSVALDFDCGE